MKLIIYLNGLAELPNTIGSIPMIPFDILHKQLFVTSVYHNPISSDYMAVCEMSDPIEDMSLELLEISSLQLEADCNEPECPA